VARLRNHVTAARAQLTANPADEDAASERDHQLAIESGHLVRVLESLDRYDSEWGDIMTGLPADDLDAEVARYDGFVQDGQHFNHWMEDAREVIYEIQCELDPANIRVQAQGAPPPVAGPAPAPVQAQNFVPMAKLPQLKLPTFEGDPLEWPSFWQSFESAVDRQPLDPVDKLSYLVAGLKGRALTTVLGYRGGENYQHAVDALKRQFGDDRVIAEALQGELIRFPPVSESDVNLRTFVETLERVCLQLKSMNIPDDNYTLLQVVKSKLPDGLLTELVQLERRENRTWKMADWRNALAQLVAVHEEVCRIRSFLAPRTHSSGDEESGSNVSGENTSSVTSQDPDASDDDDALRKQPEWNPSCFFCEEAHWATNCHRFPCIEQRREILMDQGRCLRCLGTHDQSECRSRRGCPVCGDLHHRSLCPQNVSEDSNHDNTVASVAEANAESVGIMAIVSPSMVTPSVPQSVFLMAVKVRVFSRQMPRKRIDALAFFDPGAQVTLVKKSIVDKLCLPKLIDSDLEVSPFHSVEPLKLKAPQYSIGIELENGGHETLAAHRTDWIVPSVRRADLQSGVMLAVDEEPDILIGMADFWRFFKKAEPLSSHLYCIQTLVGTMVCGRNRCLNVDGPKAVAPIVVSLPLSHDASRYNDSPISRIPVVQPAVNARLLCFTLALMFFQLLFRTAAGLNFVPSLCVLNHVYLAQERPRLSSRCERIQTRGDLADLQTVFDPGGPNDVYQTFCGPGGSLPCDNLIFCLAVTDDATPFAVTSPPASFRLDFSSSMAAHDEFALMLSADEKLPPEGKLPPPKEVPRNQADPPAADPPAAVPPAAVPNQAVAPVVPPAQVVLDRAMFNALLARATAPKTVEAGIVLPQGPPDAAAERAIEFGRLAQRAWEDNERMRHLVREESQNPVALVPGGCACFQSNCLARECRLRPTDFCRILRVSPWDRCGLRACIMLMQYFAPFPRHSL
jgi:hypothetical protein